MYQDLLKAMDFHKIKPVIDKVFPVEQVTQALDYMESGKHFGKVVLKF